MSCLSDETFAAWVSAELEDGELERAEDHAADCQRCRGMAIAMLGLVPRPGAMLGAVGATVGRYRVVAALGHGAMGVVLRGHDPVLERDVAIKMVNAIATTTEQRDRMLHEAKMLALVDHPNVVRVHDAGIADDEVFVAMEFVTGTTLVHWLAEAPRPLVARLEVLVGVGAGIAAIHEAGVVHRDIKPDNILVRGARGVIVDFGLARSSGVPGSAGSGIAGTPKFLAPEVRRGGSASALADQFAWWTVVDDTLTDIALPRRRRRALAAAIARGRANAPGDRFPTMAEAVAALRAACAPRPRWFAPAMGAVAVAAIAVGAIALVDRVRTAREEDACDDAADRVAAHWRDAREPIHRAFVATGAAYAESTFAGTARVFDRYVPAFASQIAAACRAPDDDEPAAVTAARRRCVDDRARELALQLDRFARATRKTVQQAVDGAWAMAEPACDDWRVLMFGPYGDAPPYADLAARLAAGRELLRIGRFDRALAVAEALYADARARGDAAAQVDALYLVGDLRATTDQPDAAIDALQQALRIAEAQGRDLDAAKMLALLAEQHGVVKQDAVTGHRLVAVGLAKLERIGANPVLAAYLHRIDALIYHREYRCRDAEAEIRKALAGYERVYGPDHPHVGITLAELADLACAPAADAIAVAERSFAILERAYGNDHPNVGGALVNLGNALADAGRPGEARERLVRADAILVNALGPAHSARTPALVSLADAERALGHLDAALDDLRRAGTIIDTAGGAESPEAGANHARIAKVMLETSRFADALAEDQRALAIDERALGPDHMQLVEPLLGIARAQLALRRARDAAPFAERAIALLTRRSADADPKDLAAARDLLARARTARRAD